MAESFWVYKVSQSFWIGLAASLSIALILSYLRFWRNR